MAPSPETLTQSRPAGALALLLASCRAMLGHPSCPSSRNSAGEAATTRGTAVLMLGQAPPPALTANCTPSPPPCSGHVVQMEPTQPFLLQACL